MYLSFGAISVIDDDISVIRVSSAVTAPSTPSTFLPSTVYSGIEMVPSGLTTEPPPNAFVSLEASEYSCEPLIASVLPALTVPAFRFVIVVPAVPPASVILPFVASSYATNAFVTLPDVSMFRPAAFSCARFTASVSAEPAFTFDSVVPPVPLNVTLSCADVSYFTPSTEPVVAFASTAARAEPTSPYVLPATL